MSVTRRLPTLDEMNRVFCAIMLGAGAVVGSVISFLLSGAILWGLARLYGGDFKFPASRDALLIGAAFAAYFLAEALAAAVNFNGAETLLKPAANLPFLGFLIVLGRLSLSPRPGVLQAVEVGVVVGAIAAAVFAVSQIASGRARAEGLAGNPGPFALVCCILYGLALLSAARQSGRMQIWAVIAAAAAACAILLSGMRSMWPFLLFAPVVAAMLFARSIRKPMIPLLMLAAAAALAVGFLAQDMVGKRLDLLVSDYTQVVEEQDYDNSLGERLRMWDAGLELVGLSPIFGHGPGNVEALLSLKTAEGGAEPLTAGHFHNAFLTTLVSSGILGLAAMVATMVTPLVVAFRRKRDPVAQYGLGMMVMIVASYGLSGLFGIMFGHDIHDALFIFGMIVASHLVIDEPRAGNPIG